MHPATLSKTRYGTADSIQNSDIPYQAYEGMESDRRTLIMVREERPFLGRSVISVFLIFALIAFGIWAIIDSKDDYVLQLQNLTSEPLRLVNRSTWDARVATASQKFPHPPPTHVIVIHTNSQPCNNLKQCSRFVHNIQQRHMDVLKFSDIAYNFLVGGDGSVYEGRGWDEEGANSVLFNNVSLGIAFLGNFSISAPPTQQLEEAKTLLREAVSRGHLAEDYKLVGHRQVSVTESPGQALYDIIRTWPHWEQCYMHSC